MRAVIRIPFPAVILVALAACAESGLDAPRQEITGIHASIVATCDLTAGIGQNASSYFGPMDVQRASGLSKDLTSACSSGNAATTKAITILLLQHLEGVLDGGRGGAPGTGSDLVNALLACASSLCDSAALPNIDFSAALSPFGLFAIRTTGTQDVLARGAIPFTDFLGNPNTAQWGVEVDQSWNQVTFVNPTILYGSPVLQGGVSLDELGIGDLQYRIDVYPDAGQFLDGAIHVSVCFAADVDLPASVVGLEARMQREGVVLEEHVPGFCATSTASQASIASPFLALAKRLMPARLSAVLLADTKVRVVGGTPLDFSRFIPIAAATDGFLEFVTSPPSEVTEGAPLPPILVRARSGSGTPMEVVDVVLTIRNNNGVPAGGVLFGDKQSFTREANGVQGIATFPDDGTTLFVGKPGRYLLCANGTLNEFTFEEVCTVFHARNANRK